MTDETYAGVANLIRDQKAPLAEALRWSTVMMSEIERGGEEHFDGDKVTQPIILGPQQGSGFTTESATLNTSRALSTAKVKIDTGIAHVTVSWTTKAVLAAKGGDNSWIDLVPDKMTMAEEGMKRTVNEAFCGNGDGLLAAITANNGGSTVVTVGTSANFYQLYAERYVDILRRSDGVVINQGVKITDYDEAAGTVTLDTSVTALTTSGIYIENSYGNVIQGIGQAVGVTGLFQTLNKSTTQGWRGVDASPSVTSDPTLSILDKAERKARQRGGRTPDFYIGDPAVVDKYGQGFNVQSEWAGDAGQLDSGWDGLKYRKKLIIPEYDVAPNTLYGVARDDIKIYTREHGPDWDEVNGLFKRFARSLPYESWLVWHLQMGFRRCNTQVKIGSLRQAS